MKIESYGEYEKYTLENGTLALSVITLGATVESLKYKGRETVLRYDDARGYLQGTAYICAAIGRYANRIGSSRFTLNGREYILPANEGENQLHGGAGSYDRRAWTPTVLSESSVRFALSSPDGDNGFPGKLEASVTYTLDGSTLRLDFGGVCDADTVYAPTSHMYFNLGGDNVLDYNMSVAASGWLEVDSALIPTGRIMPCEGEFDFSSMRRIARDYDHCFTLDGSHACTVEHDGLRLSVDTDFPAVQIYTASALGAPHKANMGLAIEPEAYPDSPNKPHFPTTVLRAGEQYHRYAEYTFSEL